LVFTRFMLDLIRLIYVALTDSSTDDDLTCHMYI